MKTVLILRFKHFKNIIILFFIISFHSIEARKPSRSPQGNKINGKQLEKIGAIDSKIFFMGKTRMSWSESLDFCHVNNMELATIKSAEENNLICNFLTSKMIDFAWISAIDLGAEGAWRWLKTASKVEFTNWENFEMKVENKAMNCALISQQGNGLWFTASCSTDKNYPLCHHMKK